MEESPSSVTSSIRRGRVIIPLSWPHSITRRQLEIDAWEDHLAWKPFKRLRPGAAAALPGESPHEPSHETRYLSNLVREEVCDQAMGHVNRSTYKRSHRNQIVDANIISAFLETSSDGAIMKLIGHMFLT